ncbi:DUF6113 family protein [Streptomyces sp. ST2-7A]|uniref:DUF6113 family protein n=1 Tax=Streptomyces sp. ST2-7A TaxID=2907214 RepID=UPI001F3C742E|nr:DUF6113 family protein [Streptomyces sp. ST2-7A]MCE7082154.1 DUF6113 family protein [Streptomyces sp. ST2-7A]
MTTLRFLGYAGLLLLGAVVAAAGAIVQGAASPLGLVLALAAGAGACWGGALLLGTRAGAALPAAGWGLTVLLLTLTRPRGDFVFAAGAGSYLFLFGGMLLVACCAALAPVRHTASAPARPLFAPRRPVSERRGEPRPPRR